MPRLATAGVPGVQREFERFDAYIWPLSAASQNKTRGKLRAKFPSRLLESDALSKDLQKRGFRICGFDDLLCADAGTGMVNDHL